MKWCHALLAGAAIAVLAGCADEAVVGSTSAVKQAKCAQDCAGDGKQCNPDSGKCVACLAHADCSDAGRCDPESFKCVQCLKRSDCHGKLACIAGACSACTQDTECGDGAQCDDGQCEGGKQTDGEDMGETMDGSSGNSGMD